jgi:hypothetical protein
MHTVPPLPHQLTEPTPVVLAGTALWFMGLILFGITSILEGRINAQFWTCLAGCALGLTGYGIFRWQRSASRRGSRGAWRGLTGLNGE